MNRTRIKVCGLTRAVEIDCACALGVDAIGLVFYAQSPRAVDAEFAASLLATAKPFVTVVGLFMNAESSYVRSVLNRADLDLLQFHGAEGADYCRQFGKPYIKAIPMGGEPDQNVVANCVESHPQAQGFLLDSNVAGRAGGTGETFNWQAIPALDKPVILAGGIHPDNVAEAIQVARPYAVDVSSGVEKERGVKDLALMKKFVQEVRIGDHK